MINYNLNEVATIRGSGQGREIAALMLVASAIASAEETRLNGLVRVLAVLGLRIAAISFAT